MLAADDDSAPFGLPTSGVQHPEQLDVVPPFKKAVAGETGR